MKIGLFDSGIGGLTVLKELIKIHPHHHYIYYGDNLNMPYGNKSREELFVLANNNVQFLLNKKVDLIIIACGTVSSNFGSYLKKQYHFPIYDIITPTIEYLNQNNYEDLGLIATRATVKTQTFSKKINKIKEQECPSFVSLIENNQIKTKLCEQELNKYLSPLKEVKIKTLILGCTHYPLLDKEILNFFDSQIELLNMGTILANNLNFSKETNYQLELYFSNPNKQILKNVKDIMGEVKIYSKDEGDIKSA